MMTIKQQGLTLIELMVGIVIGLIVVAGGISFYVATIQGSTNTHRSTHLTQDSNAIMQLMTNELRRAGHGILTSNLSPAGSAAGTEANCILYGYWDPVDSELVYSGFKLDNNVVKMRTVTTVIGDCTNGWQDLSDGTQVKYYGVTDYSDPIDASDYGDSSDAGNIFKIFREDVGGSGTVDVRNITIGLKAESVADAIISKSQTMIVRLRNHNFPP
jgi:prepilin peptidase dependent protein B